MARHLSMPSTTTTTTKRMTCMEDNDAAGPSSSSSSPCSASTRSRRSSRRSPSSSSSSSSSAPLLCAATLLAAALCAPLTVNAQRVAMNNVTSLTGTWSSGYGSVFTGPDFCAPTNFTFNYPNTTGISYSFTDDGHFEEAQYRFVANGSEPHCVTAVIIWQHGNYTINQNNSISLSPISSDGRIQVQDPCAAQTNVITYYNQPTLFSGWSIVNDPNHNRYMLQIYRFDGAPEPRMYLYYRPPMMLPTQQLWTSDAFKAYEQQHGLVSGSSRSISSSSLSLAGLIVTAASTFAVRRWIA